MARGGKKTSVRVRQGKIKLARKKDPKTSLVHCGRMEKERQGEARGRRVGVKLQTGKITHTRDLRNGDKNST